ncbi:MAG: hypothetical protein LBD11_07140 [Candidatus Peribacteria bacterium]|jgi:hypothetical protein|nr:hypothetical protein [Candidatus Peribacteria bacterium]
METKESYSIELKKVIHDKLQETAGSTETGYLFVNREKNTFSIDTIFLPHSVRGWYTMLAETPVGVCEISPTRVTDILGYRRGIWTSTSNISDKALKKLGENEDFFLRCITDPTGKINFSLSIEGKIINNIPWNIKEE